MTCPLCDDLSANYTLALRREVLFLVSFFNDVRGRYGINTRHHCTEKQHILSCAPNPRIYSGTRSSLVQKRFGFLLLWMPVCEIFLFLSECFCLWRRLMLPLGLGSLEKQL